MNIRRRCMLSLTLIICFFTAILLTPMIKKLAFKIGATDRPNKRKVHQKIMPRMGGLAIFISFVIGILIIRPDASYHWPIIIGGIIIIITGVVDDIKGISPKVKLLGQI